jgi:hypothetical protein
MNNETITSNSPEQITPKISAMIFDGVIWSKWSNYKGESQIASLNDAVSKIKNNPECGYYIIDADNMKIFVSDMVFAERAIKSAKVNFGVDITDIAIGFP